jgi:diguanylate cyclase (GGDEF)-like protein
MEFKQRIDEALFRHLVANSAIPLIGSALASLLVAIAQINSNEFNLVIYWVYLVYASLGIRIWLAIRSKKQLALTGYNESAALRYAFSVCLSGLAWGAGGLLLKDATPVAMIITITAIQAMVMGGVLTLGAFMPAFLAFAIPAILPMIFVFAFEDGTANSVLALYNSIFLLLMTGIAFRLNNYLRNFWQTTFEKEDLVKSLTEAHRRQSMLTEHEQFRNRTLELVAGEASLPTILEAIVKDVEQLNPSMICSILLLSSDGKHLGKGVAPSLPDFYNTALDGIEIGSSVGSCGTAAFTGKRVIVADIATHPYWAPYKELAARAGLGACWSQPILSSSGKVMGTFAIYHHATHTPVESDLELIEQSARLVSLAIERKAAENEIQSLAFYDALTHLPNRRLLLDRLKQALASSLRSGREGALLFIDLDNFKTLNDTLGHDMGDLLLQQVAKRLEKCVREGDTVSRLGGDEFIVMLEDLSALPIEAAAQTESVGEKILAALNLPYLLATHEYRSTPSIGVTLFSNHQQSIEELMKQADIAMYQAKKAGRNTLRFFDPQMQETINTRASLEDELHTALAKNEFQLYYQIQVGSSQHALGAEALIRWIHPERGIVSPLQFIPLAEETGLILPIGQWVLETACAQLKTWQQNALTCDLVLAVNVSAKQFRQADFVAQIQAVVQRHAINPKRLKLELTESLLLETIEDTVATMNALNKIGIQFSLDDFGTGYSSLQYLKRLPLDQLKIDQSFVRDLATDNSDKAIVRTIIAMAGSLSLEVIAEGVETEDQRQRLMDKGCTHYQGFLFSKPVPLEEFEALLGSLSKSYSGTAPT